ncbi:MAG: thioesterase domain-containing protein [Rhodococcus sp. (in: high G+C Gram-positive bacteria)]
MTVVNDYSNTDFTGLVGSNTVTAYAAPVIVPIRETGTQSPTFCVHPIEGLTSCYAELVEQFDEDRPVYGVQAAGGRPATLVALASQYADDILAIGAGRSIHLLGSAFGGLLAHAIAVELQRRGTSVDSLVLVDADPVHRSTDPQHELLERMGDVIDRSRAEELLAVAGHNEQLARGHFPGVFVGTAFVVSAADADTGPAWHAFVSGDVVKYTVPDTADLAVVGKLVNRLV